MKEFTLPKSSSHLVSCALAAPADPAGIVIAIHGFTSSKESSTYQRLLRRLPEAGLGVIAIDLPGHGTHESREEPLRIEGALDSIAAAEAYVRREFPGKSIFYFGSSFGAYLTGLYISTRAHAGRKAFWRSAAVNMSQFFWKENPTEEERRQMADLERQGWFDVCMGDSRPVRVSRAMYEDLRRNDLFEVFNPGNGGAHQIAMAHGLCDDVIDPEAARRFADKFGIPVTWFEGEGHQLAVKASTPDQVVDLAIAHFTGGSAE